MAAVEQGQTTCTESDVRLGDSTSDHHHDFYITQVCSYYDFRMNDSRSMIKRYARACPGSACISPVWLERYTYPGGAAGAAVL